MTLFLVKCPRQHPGGKTEICDLLMGHADGTCDLKLRVLRERASLSWTLQNANCALCHFVPFWSPPQARKNFCANPIIKQRVLGLNAPGGVFIPLSLTLSSQTFPPHGQQLCKARLYCPLGLYFYLIGNDIPAEVLLFILSYISKLVSPSLLTLAMLCGFSWTSKA